MRCVYRFLGSASRSSCLGGIKRCMSSRCWEPNLPFLKLKRLHCTSSFLAAERKSRRPSKGLRFKPDRMDQMAVSDVVKHLMLKDLRIQCRARGITPAGGREALLERLNAHMLDTGDFSLRDEGSAPQPQDAQDGNEFAPVGEAPYGNNYGRPEGQNVGNFLTDRPSSRVLAAPGGASQIIFGDGAPAAAKAAPAAPKVAPAAAKENAVQNAVTVDATGGANSLYMGDKQEGKAGHNNYGRPEGQNVGNFLTNRNSSRVLAPPGGLSQISFG